MSKQFRLKFALRTLAFPVTTLRYLHQLSRLPDLHQVMSVQGLLPAKPHRPYLRAGFSVAARAQAILDHYQLIATLQNGRLRQLLQSPGDNLLATLSGKNGETFELFLLPGPFRSRRGNYAGAALSAGSYRLALFFADPGGWRAHCADRRPAGAA
ncbi:VirK/YbjX family protein [Pantoea tagorei]